jgi:hypothetical protein
MLRGPKTISEGAKMTVDSQVEIVIKSGLKSVFYGC